MDTKLIEAIRNAFREFENDERTLFESWYEDESDAAGKDLHEICLNHRLSNHLERNIRPFIKDDLVFDIEYNRSGSDPKRMDGYLIRPDIIIHNRRTKSEKENYLIAECKKDSRSSEEFHADRMRIVKMMKSREYRYKYGLQVTYANHGVRRATIFYYVDGFIDLEIIYPKKEVEDSTTLKEIIEYLNNLEIRATYGAVGEVLDCEAIFIGRVLGKRRPETSWIVSASTLEPTGYEDEEKHPKLKKNQSVITKGDELLKRMELWRQSKIGLCR